MQREEEKQKQRAHRFFFFTQFDRLTAAVHVRTHKLHGGSKAPLLLRSFSPRKSYQQEEQQRARQIENPFNCRSTENYTNFHLNGQDGEVNKSERLRHVVQSGFVCSNTPSTGNRAELRVRIEAPHQRPRNDDVRKAYRQKRPLDERQLLTPSKLLSPSISDAKGYARGAFNGSWNQKKMAICRWANKRRGVLG